VLVAETDIRFSIGERRGGPSRDEELLLPPGHGVKVNEILGGFDMLAGFAEIGSNRSTISVPRILM
jgi:hypothetical protein